MGALKRKIGRKEENKGKLKKIKHNLPRPNYHH